MNEILINTILDSFQKYNKKSINLKIKIFDVLIHFIIIKHNNLFIFNSFVIEDNKIKDSKILIKKSLVEIIAILNDFFINLEKNESENKTKKHKTLFRFIFDEFSQLINQKNISIDKKEENKNINNQSWKFQKELEKNENVNKITDEINSLMKQLSKWFDIKKEKEKELKNEENPIILLSNLQWKALVTSNYKIKENENIEKLEWILPSKSEAFLFLINSIVSSNSKLIKNVDASKIELNNILFENLNFKNISFENSIFNNVKFINCNFSNINWINSNFQDANFKNCNLENIILKK